MMPATHGILVKLYDTKKYADAFLSGKLFANTVAHFKDLEDAKIRRDEDEGAITLPLSESTRLTLTPSGDNPTLPTLALTSSDLAAPPTLRPRWFDALNIFCMVLADAYMDDGALHCDIPPRAARFGSFAVAIFKGDEFIRRVKQAVEKRNWSLSYKQVTYYDPAVGIHTNINTLEPLFTKRDIYQAEQEYRFVIDRQLSLPTPLMLDVGPIHDIARGFVTTPHPSRQS